jgi:hypothetical protein
MASTAAEPQQLEESQYAASFELGAHVQVLELPLSFCGLRLQ